MSLEYELKSIHMYAKTCKHTHIHVSYVVVKWSGALIKLNKLQ